MRSIKSTRIRRHFYRIISLAAIIAANGLFVAQSATAQAISHNLVKYPKDKMTRLSLKKVFFAPLPVNGGSIQGFALTDKYYVIVTRPRGLEDNNHLIIIRRSDNKNVSADFGNPVYSIGHGNDATWNNKTNEIIVVDSRRKRFAHIDANNFKKKGFTELYDAKGKVISSSGIAYEKERNVYHTSSGHSIRSFNSANRLIFGFQEHHTQVNQGLAYNNGYLYRPTWESAGTYGHSLYDGIFKKNATVLYQFGLDGSFTHAYYIENPRYEVESMAFDEKNTPYLVFNGPAGFYSIYKVTDSNLLKQLRQSYKISYFDNGGIGSPKEQTAYVGIEKNLSVTEPTRTGCIFLGWSTNKNATKASYAAGSRFLKAYGSSNANVKLYAVWQQKTYSITYDANGGMGAPAAQDIIKTSDAVLSDIKPTRPGYKFLGWSAQKDAASATYRPGSTYDAKKTIMLYAVWKPKTYTITYNANGGANAPDAQTAATNEPITISETKPVHANCTFLGWAERQDATGAQYSPGVSYIGNNNTTLYAVWRQNLPSAPIIRAITITYDANGGTDAPAATTGAVDKINVSSSAPIRTNYTFLGWSAGRTGNDITYQPGAKYNGADSTTLYAVWEQRNVTVAYDANGGTNAPAAQNPAIGQVFSLASSAPTRDGYIFIGWNIDANAGEAGYRPGDQLSFNTDVLLYAIWESEAFAISFNANGGINAPLSISTATGEVVIPQTSPTRTGYIFIGWSTEADAIGAEYQPGDIVKDVDSPTLYAVWRVITPTPIADTFDDGSSDIAMDYGDESVTDTSEENGGEDDNIIVATTEDPEELPASGPIEIIIAVIASVCIICGGTYLIISGQQLRRLQQFVRGQAAIRISKKRK